MKASRWKSNQLWFCLIVSKALIRTREKMSKTRAHEKSIKKNGKFQGGVLS